MKWHFMSSAILMGLLCGCSMTGEAVNLTDSTPSEVADRIYEELLESGRLDDSAPTDPSSAGLFPGAPAEIQDLLRQLKRSDRGDFDQLMDRLNSQFYAEKWTSRVRIETDTPGAYVFYRFQRAAEEVKLPDKTPMWIDLGVGSYYIWPQRNGKESGPRELYLILAEEIDPLNLEEH